MIDIKKKHLCSEIINDKKQIILKVDQTSDFVYPNELYKYQIYCKNVSGDIIENVHIQVLNPSVVYIDEDENNEGIDIGNLNNGQSHFLNLSARCAEVGEFTVHFVCFGNETGLFYKSLTIKCNYDFYNDKTIHRVNIYNFTPYEDTYELLSKDYNEDVTQLVKRQKLPWKAKEHPFSMEEGNEDQGIYVDESQNYLDQKEILYGDKYNTDEHTYQYLEREIFDKDVIEKYEGENLKEIFENINKYSKFFKAIFLRTGTNYLYNDFRQYNPDGFIYRFGLMNSEIFHHLGVIPDYSYMNDYLFRWASDDSFAIWSTKGRLPKTLYPKRIDMNWNKNIWAGRGYNVWRVYTDEYKEQIINSPDYKPLYEFIHTFETLLTAETYIDYENKYNKANEYYVHTEDGTEIIRKYQYIIKESYFDSGVFFVNIPLNKIPTNFMLLDIEDIEAIIEKTKPFGMKALIRYVINAKFDMYLNLKTHLEMHPRVGIDFESNPIFSYSMIPYQYQKVIESLVCGDNNIQREAIRMIPCGKGYSHSTKFDLDTSVKIEKPDISDNEKVDLTTNVTQQVHKCNVKNNLTYFSDIQDLLYESNFDDISFYLDDVKTEKILKESTRLNPTIESVSYQLWIESLYDENGDINVNPHSFWWNKDSLEDIYKTKIDFFEMPLSNADLVQYNIESGIGFKDSNGKLHGISIENKREFRKFFIKYATSKNKNFRIIKQGLDDISGIAFKFVEIGNHTLVVFLLKKEIDDNVKYYYFDHSIINEITDFFCFIRNDKDISSIVKWSDVIRVGEKTNSKVIFNTPQYQSFNSYDPNLIGIADNSVWKNISRIDKNESSYTVAQNLTEDEITTDDITLHFDDINIPDDAIVKRLMLKLITESNSYKSIYPKIRFQDGFITENSSISNLILYPNQIECYPAYNTNTEHYEYELSIAEQNNITKSIKNFKNKIIENTIFNESLNYSTDYISDPDDYITVKNPYWIELSDLDREKISANEFKYVQFYIEGYNSDQETKLTLQLFQDEIFAERKTVLIPSGYFKKYITLEYNNSFSTNEMRIKFRFNDLNSDLQIFNTYFDITLKNKQNIKKGFEDVDFVDIDKKKEVQIDLINEDTLGYMLTNGLTTVLSFDDLEAREYYRIYSVELNVVYEKQNIDFIVGQNINESETGSFIALGGTSSNDFLSGMFFDEVIMPGAYQPNNIISSEEQGIKLEEGLYQSFLATTNNMTGITIYPNGFVGNPDVNLKISLYENKGNTPNRLIKQIRAKGWSKANNQLKNSTVISYSFNVNNLKIGEVYWIKIEVENVKKGHYYLLKYLDSIQPNMRLLLLKDNNLINALGCLQFHINTVSEFESFKSLPTSEDRDLVNPKIFIGLNKRTGEIKNLKLLTISEGDSIENT